MECGLIGGIGFGGKKGNNIIKELRDMYEKLSFYNNDGSINLKPSPHYITEFLQTKGLKRENVIQKIDTMKIYPTDFFAPKDYFTGKIKLTSNTISIHQYNASWISHKKKLLILIQKIIGTKNFEKLISLKNKIFKKK